MPPDDRARVLHMIEAAESALRFVAGRCRRDLDDDEMLRFALTRAIEIVGEAASQVSEAGRAQMSGVPWRQVVGMRNRLVHAYFDINRDVLWETATDELPALLSALRASRPND